MLTLCGGDVLPWPFATQCHEEGHQRRGVRVDRGIVGEGVYVFQKEKREFYALEELWGDALDVKFEGK